MCPQTAVSLQRKSIDAKNRQKKINIVLSFKFIRHIRYSVCDFSRVPAKSSRCFIFKKKRRKKSKTVYVYSLQSNKGYRSEYIFLSVLHFPSNLVPPWSYKYLAEYNAGRIYNFFASFSLLYLIVVGKISGKKRCCIV